MARSFDDWMAAVDAALLAKVGMDHMDLPDIDYWDRWDGGGSPSAAANAAIREA